MSCVFVDPKECTTRFVLLWNSRAFTTWQQNTWTVITAAKPTLRMMTGGPTLSLHR